MVPSPQERGSRIPMEMTWALTMCRWMDGLMGEWDYGYSYLTTDDFFSFFFSYKATKSFWKFFWWDLVKTVSGLQRVGRLLVTQELAWDNLGLEITAWGIKYNRLRKASSDNVTRKHTRISYSFRVGMYMGWEKKNHRRWQQAISLPLFLWSVQPASSHLRGTNTPHLPPVLFIPTSFIFSIFYLVENNLS